MQRGCNDRRGHGKYRRLTRSPSFSSRSCADAGASGGAHLLLPSLLYPPCPPPRYPLCRLRVSILHPCLRLYQSVCVPLRTCMEPIALQGESPLAVHMRALLSQTPATSFDEFVGDGAGREGGTCGDGDTSAKGVQLVGRAGEGTVKSAGGTRLGIGGVTGVAGKRWAEVLQSAVHVDVHELLGRGGEGREGEEDRWRGRKAERERRKGERECRERASARERDERRGHEDKAGACFFITLRTYKDKAVRVRRAGDTLDRQDSGNVRK